MMVLDKAVGWIWTDSARVPGPLLDGFGPTGAVPGPLDGYGSTGARAPGFEKSNAALAAVHFWNATNTTHVMMQRKDTSNKSKT